MELTKMAKGISLVTIFIYFLQSFIDLSIFALYSDPDMFKGYQLITHMLLHQNLAHIVSNLLLFIIVAPVVENYLKSDIKFLQIYLYSGIVGGIAQMITSGGASIGASGAIYGILGACIFMNPKYYIKIFRIRISILIIAILMIVQEVISCIEQTTDGIGHYAHIGGLLTGIIFYFFNRNKSTIFVK